MAFRILLQVAVLSVVVAASAPARTVVHERRLAVPHGFVRKGAAPANDMLTLRVALASNNVAGLEAKLASLATPGSAEFRQWLSKDEVKSFVEPSPETVSAFNAFASANGLKPTVISPNGDWVSITLPVSQANELFNAQFEVFTHAAMDAPITRTLSVSLPVELVGHVGVLHPTTEFTEPDARLVPASASPRGQVVDSLKRQDTSCDTSVASGVITPACLQALYGIPATPATSSTNLTNPLLVTGYVSEWAQSTDLTAFLTKLRPDIPPNTTFSLLSLDGGVNPQLPILAGTEANLDIQYTLGIATGVPVEFLSVGGSFTTALLDTTTFLDGIATPPTVMTTSYGTTESSIGLSMATKICNSYMALGSRGISIVFASGDGGVRGNHDDSSVCNNNVFAPVFPAACPFVTTVGSTFGFAPEKAINFTGGGFSNFFPTPYYQSTAVSYFLATGVPKKFNGTFNATGRGYPDVALQGWNFEIFDDGEDGTVGGTSASAPTFAGLLTLINDELISAGKPVLGFVNPFLYEVSASGKGFTDVTEGHNSGFVCPASSVAFDAAVGWDPLTGSGTPIYSELLAAALA
ncbi:family S53 protease-like protein [Mycena capillaripes]|nr:family S53 protease-like protein [Mycena capillaripes]